MLPLVFLTDIVLNFVLFVQLILGVFPCFDGYHHWHQSCRAGNPSECWLIRIRWHLKTAGRDKAQNNQSAQQFTLHTSAALAGWTSNELQITNKVTSTLSLASGAEDKERLQGVAKKHRKRQEKCSIKTNQGQGETGGFWGYTKGLWWMAASKGRYQLSASSLGKLVAV